MRIQHSGADGANAQFCAGRKTVGGCEWSRRCVSMVVGEAFAAAQSERVPLDCTREVTLRVPSCLIPLN